MGDRRAVTMAGSVPMNMSLSEAATGGRQSVAKPGIFATELGSSRLIGTRTLVAVVTLVTAGIVTAHQMRISLRAERNEGKVGPSLKGLFEKSGSCGGIFENL
jgi:hypothetical protein